MVGSQCREGAGRWVSITCTHRAPERRTSARGRALKVPVRYCRRASRGAGLRVAPCAASAASEGRKEAPSLCFALSTVHNGSDFPLLFL